MVAATGLAALLVLPAMGDPVIEVVRKSDGSYDSGWRFYERAQNNANPGTFTRPR